MRAATLACLALIACRAPDRPVVDSVEAVEPGPAGGLHTRRLFASPRLSAHATSVSGSLAPHLHAHHEETVYVVAGRARMRIGDAWHELGPGDVAHVPEGVVHAVEVDGTATVLSVFAPPFDGTDRVFVER